MRKAEQYPVREWTDPTVDKSTWDDGPWKTEPDKIQWVDELSQLDCLMVRNHMGSWCGYVGVDVTHPLHRKPYQDVPDLSCHGGLTFAAECTTSCECDWPAMDENRVCQKCRRPVVAEGEESFAVCHTPYEGRPHDVWWFGFDCAHYNDWLPGHEARMRELELKHPEMPRFPEGHAREEIYRDRAYVEKECRRLAAQLAAIGRNHA